MTMSNTILAFLLALGDYSEPLSEQEQQTLKEVAQQLNTQPRAWKKFTEPLLLETIKANPKLAQSYQNYADKLDKLDKIPLELLPKSGEVNQLITNQSSLTSKGFPPVDSATGYEQQINNLVIVVAQGEEPTEIVKKLGFLAEMKQLLDDPSR